MAKKDAVKTLVQSLTKGEKRHFKLQSQLQSGVKNYLALFDFIDKNEDCDAQSMKRFFADHAMGRQLHVTKNYLSSMVMKSLRSFHDKKSKRHELSDLINDIEIQFDKELFDHCEATIKKAKNVAEKYEKFPELLLILGWERRLSTTRLGPYKSARIVGGLLAIETEVIAKIQNQNEYQQLINQLLVTDFNYSASLSEIQDSHLLQHEDKAMSFYAKVLYYHLHYILNTLTRQVESAENIITSLITLFESQVHHISDNMESYVTSLNNLMSFYIHRRRESEAIDLLYKIRRIPAQYGFENRSYILKVFLKTYNAELELYRDTKEWEKGLELIEEVKSFIDNNSKIVTEGQLISFYYQFAYIFFMSGNYSESLKALNHMINENLNKERQDVITFSRFLLLMVHFELGNIIVLRYAVDSTRRYLKKNKGKLISVEQRLLRFFSKLSTSVKSDYPMLFEKLQSELFIDIEESQKIRILDYIDFESWISANLK